MFLTKLIQLCVVGCIDSMFWYHFSLNRILISFLFPDKLRYTIVKYKVLKCTVQHNIYPVKENFQTYHIITIFVLSIFTNLGHSDNRKMYLSNESTISELFALLSILFNIISSPCFAQPLDSNTSVMNATDSEVKGMSS